MSQELRLKLSIMVFFFLFLYPLLVYGGVQNTKHNLSVSGPGPAQAISETQVCIFCHTPHNANPAVPLWGHEISEANYINYWSPTLKSYPSAEEAPPIDGFSKLCLSCHDGTIALGSVLKREIETVPDQITFGMEGYLGTDLSGGHPISIVYDSELADLRNADPNLVHLRWPINDPEGYVRLYPTQGDFGVQCTSCHDPHGGRGAPDEPPFWQKTTHDDVCLVCHSFDDGIPEGGHEILNTQ